MAEIRISQLSEATDLTDDDLVVVDSSNVTKKMKLLNFFKNLLRKNSNLSDLPDKSVARTNLGVLSNQQVTQLVQQSTTDAVGNLLSQANRWSKMQSWNTSDTTLNVVNNRISLDRQKGNIFKIIGGANTNQAYFISSVNIGTCAWLWVDNSPNTQSLWLRDETSLDNPTIPSGFKTIDLGIFNAAYSPIKLQGGSWVQLIEDNNNWKVVCVKDLLDNPITLRQDFKSFEQYGVQNSIANHRISLSSGLTEVINTNYLKTADTDCNTFILDVISDLEIWGFESYFPYGTEVNIVFRVVNNAIVTIKTQHSEQFITSENGRLFLYAGGSDLVIKDRSSVKFIQQTKGLSYVGGAVEQTTIQDNTWNQISLPNGVAAMGTGPLRYTTTNGFIVFIGSVALNPGAAYTLLQLPKSMFNPQTLPPVGFFERVVCGNVDSSDSTITHLLYGIETTNDQFVKFIITGEPLGVKNASLNNIQIPYK